MLWPLQCIEHERQFLTFRLQYLRRLWWAVRTGSGGDMDAVALAGNDDQYSLPRIPTVLTAPPSEWILLAA